jgi:hypothetical protein
MQWKNNQLLLTAAGPDQNALVDFTSKLCSLDTSEDIETNMRIHRFSN